jgi:hypothetical protein
VKSERYLKDENQKTVIAFVVWCIVLYLLSSVGAQLSISAIQAKVQELSVKDGLAMVIMPVLILVLSGIIPSRMKEVLVFWRMKHPLPGCRAFSQLAARDERIDMNCLRERLGALPTEPREQNAAWYKLLKRYSDVTIVEKAHKYFLLSRDLSSIALVFAILGCTGLFIEGSSSRVVLEYTLFMLLQYVVLAVVARNHANRLVCNVLSEFTRGSNV